MEGIAQPAPEYPALRLVEAFPVESNGEQLLCLRDPEHLAENIVLLHPAAGLILTLFDGRHSLEEVQAAFLRRTGQKVEVAQLRQLVADLDRQLFLDSPRFRQVREQIEADFRQAPLRSMAHAGKAYEDDPAVLGKRLDDYMRGAPSAEGKVRGIIAPHIDYGRGGRAYGTIYGALKTAEPHDIYVVLGTCHAPMRHLFTATPKAFDTPLGAMQTDREFVARLAKAYGPTLLDDERAHRTEHSIELQTVFLRRLQPHARIVPILVGSFHRMVQSGTSPWETPAVREFVEALQSVAQACGQSVCYVAAADLAHIGTRFGDPEPATESLMQWVAQEDALSLQAAAAVNAEGWFASNAKDGDRRRVCGLSPVYTFLKVLGDDVHGRLLRYEQCNEPTGSNNVTIASVAYYEKTA